MDSSDFSSSPDQGEPKTAREAEAERLAAIREHRARVEALRQSMPAPKHRKWPYVVSAIIAVLALGGVAYWYFALRQPSEQPQPSVPATPATPRPQTGPTQPEPLSTKPYTSSAFGMSFTYPDTWTVKEENTLITVTAPPEKRQNAAGQAITGKTVITFNHKGQNLAAFDAGNAVAVRTSEKMKYTNPTQAQRAETYLTFAQYAATTTTGALDAIYVTGNYGYQKYQAIPKVDLMNADPLISVTFVRCSDDACQGPVSPTAIQASAWDSESFKRSVLTTLQSISID